MSMFNFYHYMHLLLIVFLVFIKTPIIDAQIIHEISLHEELVIGSEESDELYQWAGITSDKKGNIYLSDAMDYSIKKFNPHGIFLKKIGRKGKGPGEFMAPRCIVHHNDKLFITDQNRPGIQVIDAKIMKYLSNIPCKWPITDFCVHSEDEIIISALSGEGDGKLFILNPKGKISKSITFAKKEKNFFLNSFNFDLDDNFNFYISFSWKDMIIKTDSGGKILWKKQFYSSFRMENKSIEGIEVPVNVVYKDILTDTLGNIFVLSGHYAKNRGRDVLVLDSDGHPITTFTLPESSHMIYIDHNNFLYTRAGLGTILKKYSLTYH